MDVLAGLHTPRFWSGAGVPRRKHAFSEASVKSDSRGCKYQAPVIYTHRRSTRESVRESEREDADGRVLVPAR